MHPLLNFFQTSETEMIIYRNQTHIAGINSATKELMEDELFTYSCRYCVRVSSWRSIACCRECYEAYTETEQVSAARALGEQVSLIPEKTDMTERQYSEIMETPIEQVRDYSIKEELAGYSEEIETVGFAETIKDINTEILGSEESKPKTRGKKKKSEAVEQ